MGNETLRQGVFFPGRKHPASGAADKRTDTEKREHRRQINRQIKAADPRRDQDGSEKTRPQEIQG
jgi:hypothetical protein